MLYNTQQLLCIIHWRIIVVLLFGKKLRKKLLGYAFTHADREFYVRELAELIQEDPGNLSRELKKLEAEGLYNSRIKGSLKYYSLNKNYPLFQELKKVIFKTEGAAGALKNIVEGYSGINQAFIYGSYAKNREKETSDIDLMVIGQFPRKELTRQIRELESRLGREINFISYTPEEFEKERKKAGGFLHLVLKDKKFVLKGTLNGR